MSRTQVRLFGQLSQCFREKKVSYLHTLNLPQTPFSPKLPTSEERQALLKRTGEDIYHWQQQREDFLQEFTLHDGPPYANGDLHLGHSLNKILKDFINRFELLHNNSKVNYTPGWDCHGLPIETKAVDKADLLSDEEIRTRCRRLASSMVEKQKDQFREFAIMADFDQNYLTMSHDYESRQLRVFLKLYENGLLSRQLKPVWWGCETETALAEAELDYNANHKSVAVHVKFPITSNGWENKHFLIWTSTPWTIPANKAICCNRNIDYVELVSDDDIIITAEALADSIIALRPQYKRNGKVHPGADLVGLTYQNPSNADKATFPVLHGDHVNSLSGTGLVHTAPAHGMEDYLIGKKHGLEIASVVDKKGLYIEDCVPPGYREFAGRYANGKPTIKEVLQRLDNSAMLFKIEKNYVHSYPYDWRLKTPVIQRATPQWFVNVDKIKAVALKLLESVEFIPESGRNRLSAFVAHRNEWCISRQRVWGVPLPMVYDKLTQEPVEDLETVRTIVERIGEYGTDAWFAQEENISRWLPDGMDGLQYVKGKDTMDVWFDSGTSWTSLLKNPNDMGTEEVLADIYLEGSDQHRGWFQSSLLNRIISSGTDGHFKPVAPFKKIITHGFTLDKNNDKMSKSKGNVISPTQVIEGGGKPLIQAMGTDGLRLWVASSNYTQDVSVNSEVLKRVAENLKKLRITFKFLLGNLKNYKGPLEYDQLSALDKWALFRLHKLQQQVVEGYRAHNYNKVIRVINNHVSEDLSSLYFDICKDCLYTHASDSLRRRGVQTVLEQILKTYVGLLAPIQPMLTQEVWEEMDVKVPSPFMESWAYYAVPEKYLDPALEEEMANFWQIRDSLYKTLEALKGKGLFKNRLEAKVVLQGTTETTALLERHSEYLDDYFLVSKVEVLAPSAELPDVSTDHGFITDLSEGRVVGVVERSDSCKCPRCWKHISTAEDKLCGKCEEVICK